MNKSQNGLTVLLANGTAKTPLYFVGPYWEDSCPECGELAVNACRCIINDRTCTNGHTWHRQNGLVVKGSGH